MLNNEDTICCNVCCKTKSCCICYKGETGERGPVGPRGPVGERGLQGEIGPAGEPFSRVFGTFYGFPNGPYSNGSLLNAITIPVTNAAASNTPGAFTLNSDGTVTVNESGMYLTTVRVQVNEGSSGNFVIEVNDSGSGINTLRGSTIVNGGNASITTILTLKTGDAVSNGYVGVGPVYLTPYIEQVRSPSSTITLVKIAEIPAELLSEVTDSNDSMQIE